MATYVRRDARLALLLKRMRQRGKTFLLTNSDYFYTRPIMQYLLEGWEPGMSWMDYFGAAAPRRCWAWLRADPVRRSQTSSSSMRTSRPFSAKVRPGLPAVCAADGGLGAGSALRAVDPQTGALKLTAITQFQQGVIYRGGSLEQFARLSGAKGREVLFVGDHIFGDIIKSKKTQGWNTLMIIPELTHELQIWVRCRALCSYVPLC
jgi:5'-nucleotidase